ncbi:MAG: hypothetical protein KJO69_10885, partial [Gammaproteobacteria bacterium]|nr:hypothetical protein [Gammaproteobacteria bacterium]
MSITLFNGGTPTPFPAPYLLPLSHSLKKVPWTTVPYASQTAADTSNFVIAPRPDSETDLNGGISWYRWAHPDMDYERDLYVRGGRAFYNCEIDTSLTNPALTGITILRGGTGPTGYLWFKVFIPQATIAALTPGIDYFVAIKWFDQESSELRMDYSLQVEGTPLSHFFFLDNSQPTNGTGTFSNPFNSTNNPAYLAYSNGVSAAGKICVLKQGNSATPGSEYQWSNAITGPMWPTTSKLPCAVINIPGETPVIDLNAEVSFGLEGTAANPTDDYKVYGIKFINGWSTADGGGAIGRGAFSSFFNNNAKRWGITHCFFDTVNAWITIPNHNNGALTFDGTTALREHGVVANNEFSNAVSPATNNVGAAIMHMGGEKIIIENNTVRDWGTTGSGVEIVFKLKKPSDNLTVRRNIAVDNVTVWTDKYGIEMADDASTSPYTFDNTEICYNVFEFPTTLRPRWMGMTATLAVTGNV